MAHKCVSHGTQRVSVWYIRMPILCESCTRTKQQQYQYVQIPKYHRGVLTKRRFMMRFV